MIFCDKTAGIEVSFKTHGQASGLTSEGQANMEVEIVI